MFWQYQWLVHASLLESSVNDWKNIEFVDLELPVNMIEIEFKSRVTMRNRSTLIFEGAWGLVAKYSSFIEWRLATILGKMESKPGTRLSTQISSFSIQSRSWLLHTEMISRVCRRLTCVNLKLKNVGTSYDAQWSRINIQTCIWVLIIAFPITVAKKNSQNGIPNCPHIRPARSNKGLGTYKISPSTWYNSSQNKTKLLIHL